MANWGERNNIRRLKDITAGVEEAAKIKLDDVLNKFQLDNRLTDFTFPPNLTNTERAHIHYQCGRMGFKSVSNGVGEQRRVTISKLRKNNAMVIKPLELSPQSLSAIQALGSMRPPEQYLHANGQIDPFIGDSPEIVESSSKNKYTNRLSIGPFPKVPKPKSSTKFDAARKRLPIWNYKEKILQVVASHKVTFIKGDTGCGKTTQVPQFFLEDATEHKKQVRVLCTVPRRIAAVSISDRVAAERGERVGFTVGYQIRLESCVSPTDTLLTYCTSGVLLRSLTSFDYTILKNTTHIIIDEVHERDRQTDFLLACLKDVGKHFPNLRIILMGADMDSHLLTSYFGGIEHCPLLEVEGRLHPVKILFLENILELLDYKSYEMQAADKQNGRRSKTEVYRGLVEKLRPQSAFQTNSNQVDEPYLEANEKNYDADEMIQQVWSNGDEHAMQEFLNLTRKNVISVNYQHSEHHVTMLMATAARGMINFATELLSMGADVNIKMLHEGHERYLTAKIWASDYGQHEMVNLLSEHEFSKVLTPSNNIQDIDPIRQDRLLKYQSTVDDDRVDLMLILKLLQKIHLTTDVSHAILVFLPGYEEIVTLKQILFADPGMYDYVDSFVVFLLHSNIQTGDQKAAFEKPGHGVRKILLSTNIAETSLTIEDVVYVIDSGKVKEKSYDTMTGVTQLKSNWISKASANQRQGRAGRCRPGTCYRMYSSSRYESMSAFPTPEIVRSSLQELCLYTRAFIRGNLNIGDFFSRLPETPAPIAVKKAVDMLIAMGALDTTEQLTKLGRYLLDFPVEPSLGKALIYAVVLKCLDPILTIISVVSYRDPFQLPADPSEKKRALETKLKFSSDTMSDHMATLTAFQHWENAKLYSRGTDKRFLRDNYLSGACFEMVSGIRTQLLGQLRSSGFVKSKGGGDLRDLNVNSDNWALVKGVLTGSMYPNICAIDREKNCLYNEFENKILFHQSSTVIMKRKGGVQEIPTNWVVFDEMSQQGNSRMVRGNTCVGDTAVTLFAGNCVIVPVEDGGLSVDLTEGQDLLNSREPTFRLEINRWISFQGDKLTAQCVLHLREKLHELMFKKLKKPSHNYTKKEEAILQTIAVVLILEDEKDGLKTVKGIGEWPQLATGKNIISGPHAGYRQSQATNAFDMGNLRRNLP